MNTDDQPPETGCPGCRARSCPLEAEPDDSTLAGWRLAFASAGLLLGPVLLAIIGAAVAGTSHEARVLGGLVGLAVGVAASAGVAKLLERGKEKESPPANS